jgi:formylglycine-generating enzyme required for sulfatase activity
LTFSWTRNGQAFDAFDSVDAGTTRIPSDSVHDGDVFVCHAEANDGQGGVVVREASATVFNPTNPGIEMVRIEPGTFLMGSPDTDPEAYDWEKPQRQVTLTQPFLLAKTEVTQAQYLAVMGVNPSSLTGDPNRPVESVTWNQAVAFCDRLSEMNGVAHGTYGLPTEAQWEYAARAGTTTARYGELDSIAWSGANSGGTSHPVGQKLPNAWGLYDMLGNVWEWTSDWYGDYGAAPMTDPTGPASGPGRSARGGGWDLEGQFMRAMVRGYVDRDDVTFNILGFRPRRSLP